MKYIEIFRKYLWQILIIVIVAATAYLYFSTNDTKSERTFPVMGTFAHTVIYGSPAISEKAGDKVRDVFTSIEKTCNIFDPDSEISLLNRTAHEKPFKCSPLLWNMFNSSRRAYDISEGAFDVSARPLMLLWGFYRKRGDSLPSASEITREKTKVGLLDKVIFDDKNHTVKFRQAGMSIDFGGIAKGIAVQVAAKEIAELGVKRAVIDLGGNMYCLGKPHFSKSSYTIGIRDPLAKNAICARIELRDQAVATSGDYERYVVIKGHHYAHIMNPATGLPVEDMLSVTVVSQNAGDCDFLSTAIFIKGPEFAREICRANPDIGVFIMRRDSKDKSRTETIKIGNLKIR